MKCILIFDYINDIVYSKYDKKFMKHVKKLGRLQGLISEEKDEDEISTNVLIQIFSPIVTSQRMMYCQFGNSYSAVQCEDGTTMIFEDYMGYLFLQIGEKHVAYLKRMLGVCITIIKHLCGPDVSALKSDKKRAMRLSRILDAWVYLEDTDQSVLVEAVEPLMVNADLSSITMKALQEATEKIKSKTDFMRIHALIFVENKFLGIYSSKNSQELLPSEILFLGLLSESFQLISPQHAVTESTETEDAESSEEFYSPQTSPHDSPALSRKHGSESSSMSSEEVKDPTSLSELLEKLDGVKSQIVFLTSNGPIYSPHVVHVICIEEGVNLVLVFETGNMMLSMGLYETFYFLNLIQNVQMRKDIENVRRCFDNLDFAVKKVFESLKKNQQVKIDVEHCQRKLHNQWDFIRKKYLEYLKTSDPECILRVESSTNCFVDTLKEMLRLACFDTDLMYQGREAVLAAVSLVRHKLEDFSEFLKVKALRNFTMGSRASLTINKYLEEFPGLVHFLYIDRTNHRITAPSLDFSSEETVSLTKKKIWSMIEFTRTYLQDGHRAIMWKDTTFNYAYFLWFEDTAGSPLKPKLYPKDVIKNFPRPGILCGDFYHKLVEACFPKTSPGKVRCYELYCIHLGLATSSCVLQHTRRLAATIWEVTGPPSNQADLL